MLVFRDGYVNEFLMGNADDMIDEHEDRAEAERMKRASDEADEAADAGQREEEERENDYQDMKEWFLKVGAPGTGSFAEDRRKDSMSKQGLKRAGAKLPRGSGNVRFHDGNCVEPVPCDDEKKPVHEKCDDGERVDVKKGFRYSIAKRIGLVASVFWGAVDVHNRLKTGKLTPGEVSRKQQLICTLTENHPLSQFEREFCVAHTMLEKPLPFAKVSEGGVLLEHIAQAGKKRIDIDAKNGKKKKNEEKANKADAITKQLLDKVGIDFKPVAAEMGVKAQQDSLRANCLKAIPDRFAATKQQLRAFEAVHYVPFEPPQLDDEGELDKPIRDAICHMDKSKSAGSDGFTRGHNEKGNFLAADIFSIIDATKRRLRRLEVVGGDIGLFTGIELVQYFSMA